MKGNPFVSRWTRWIQINAPIGPRFNLDRLFEVLGAALRTERERGRVRKFFYMLKEPGLRLRFLLSNPKVFSETEVSSALATLVDEGVLGTWYACRYEPEVHLFGGVGAMAAVHTYFDADCRAIMAWRELFHTGQTRLKLPALSVRVLHDLFTAVVGENSPEEVWDVWCNLGRLHRVTVAPMATGEPPPAPAVSPSREPAKEIEGLDEPGTSAEQEVLRIYSDANQRLAARLRELLVRGKLRSGRRGILPFVANFHWNRLSLLPPTRQQILSTMIQTTAPNRGMR
jgi:thiopeptide-type bacteriocin biosynthesis protein